MNQYWKNQQFNRIEKIKRSDENWLKKEVIPHFEQTLRKIYDYLDYYTSRMSENGEISVSKSREVPSKEDVDRLSLIHISEPTRLRQLSRMPSSA